MINNKYGKWKVLSYSHVNHRKEKMWKCECACGTIRVVKGTNLNTGRSKSCGCVSNKNLNTKHFTHRLSKTKIYDTWTSLKYRCNNSNSPNYKNYGERGISVCEEWVNDFLSFYEWSMKNGYEEDLTIDRIDNEGDYTPDNCRWTDRVTQMNNRRNTIRLKFNGKLKTLTEWSRLLGVPYNTLYSRYSKGCKVNEIFKVKG